MVPEGNPNQPIGSLSWDGSHLGSFDSKIRELGPENHPQSYFLNLPNGSIQGTMRKLQDNLICIVEEIKELFHLRRQPFHLITLSGKLYVLYPIPSSQEITLDKLSQLQLSKEIQDQVRREVQRLICFWDFLLLSHPHDSSIHLQPNDLKIIGTNSHQLTKNHASMTYHNYISQKLLYAWFDEKITMTSVANEMVKSLIEENQELLPPDQIDPNLIEFESDNLESNRIGIISHVMRTKLETIIKKYNHTYIWYASFVVNRICRYLLDEG